MKISYSWLQEFLNVDLEVEEVGEILTDLGLEVEGIERFETIKGSLKGVVVGEILSCEQHPNADRLKVAKVDLGNGEAVQIVCGAPNVAVGQKVPVATIGTVLYTKDEKSFTIKKGKIRGENSFGMICAQDELGLGTDHEGILVLENDAIIGTPVSELFNIKTDFVFEIGLTPNRADAMSHFGVARDLRAGLLQTKQIKNKLITPAISNFHIDERTFKINVDVENTKLAPRYAGITIANVKVMDSPNWLLERLRSIGLKPINNIVDITNYILHGLGQPLHAFDADKIGDSKIVVKNLPEGTKFVTLDGVERKLHQDDLMICDAKGMPMCIAGVFGGENSGVSSSTKTIFLESAYFDPISIRKTAKRHGLNTDASFRFERGIDVDTVVLALKRAAILICDIAGGKIVSDIVDNYPNKLDDFQVHLSYDRVNRLIGEEIATETIKNILASLDIKIDNQTESGLGLTIPSYRVDVTREADIVEEILRVYGYNNIEIPQKLNSSILSTKKIRAEKMESLASNFLVSQGFYEAMSNSLTKPEYIEKSDWLRQENNVNMLNALSIDLSVLRQSMLFGGLESIVYNINRKNSNLKYFEFGSTYHKYENTYSEQKHLSLILSGNLQKDSWNVKPRASDFYYLKGIISSLLLRLGIERLRMKSINNDIFSEGIVLQFGKLKMAEFGIIRQDILKSFSIKQEVLFADINWDNVLKSIGKKELKVKSLPKYPAVKRDLALLIKSEIKFMDLYEAAFQSERKYLKEVDLFDVYTGDKLPKDKKSYALSFVLQDEGQTLTDKQIDNIMNKLQRVYISKFGAELR